MKVFFLLSLLQKMRFHLIPRVFRHFLMRLYRFRQPLPLDIGSHFCYPVLSFAVLDMYSNGKWTPAPLSQVQSGVSEETKSLQRHTTYFLVPPYLI